jgi:hypothetical protein
VQWLFYYVGNSVNMHCIVMRAWLIWLIWIVVVEVSHGRIGVLLIVKAMRILHVVFFSNQITIICHLYGWCGAVLRVSSIRGRVVGLIRPTVAVVTIVRSIRELFLRLATMPRQLLWLGRRRLVRSLYLTLIPKLLVTQSTVIPIAIWITLRATLIVKRPLIVLSLRSVVGQHGIIWLSNWRII